MKPFIFIAVTIIFFLSCSRDPNFKIVDYFVDSTERGKFVFLFVETDTLIQNKMLEWTSEFKTSDTLMRVENDTIFNVLISYFYVPGIYDEITEEKSAELQEKYNNTEIAKKLLLAKNGAVYTGFSRVIEGLPYPKDTIMMTSVFVPRKGYKAIDILKQRNEND